MKEKLGRQGHPWLTLLLAGGLAFGIASLLGLGGCDDDDSGTVCPGSPVIIEQIELYPDSTTTIGDSLYVLVDARGSNLKYEYSTTHGRFVVVDGDYARWKAPSVPVIAEVSVVAYNDEGSDAASISIPVSVYVPRHEPAYVGAATCGLECHEVSGHGEHYDTWINTSHADTYDRLTETSGGEIDDCAACHTVGFSDVDSVGALRHNGGFDEVPIESLEGVQCENCHGPLSTALGDTLPDHGAMGIGNFLYEVGTPSDPTGCGTCHETIEHDRLLVTEWSQSQHALSHEAEGAGVSSCTYCHTAQGFVEYVETGSRPPSAPSIRLPITCVACHDPHDGSQGAGLRAGFDDDVCSGCHSDAGLTYPDPPHAPQKQVLAGEGGYEYALAMPSSPHGNVSQRGCATCHYPTGAGSVSHTFVPDDQSCLACHPAATGQGFGWSDEMAEVADSLQALEEELARATEADKATDAYQQARFNADFLKADGSSGAHNYKYAIQLLKESLARFEPSEGR